MRVLKFKVTGQDIQPVETYTGLVPGSKGYLFAEFEFNREWNGCRKAASFWLKGKEFPVVLHENKCEIPEGALTRSAFQVSCTGVREGYRITTNQITIKQEG